MRIALLGKDLGWGGGAEFLRYLANGLLTRRNETKSTLFLLLPVENRIETIEDALRVLKRSTLGMLRGQRPWFAVPRPAFHSGILDYFRHIQNGQVAVVYHENSPKGLLRCLRKIQADVALPVNGTLGTDYPIPWIGYVPDFQHKYLQHNFDASGCLDRDIRFASTLKDSTAVLVNAKAVKNDILQFYPYVKTQVFDLPFSPSPLPEWFDDLPYDISARYQLPGQFFLISNQFWVHKDHLTAFRALAQSGLPDEVGLVCTGLMDDYRRPDYIAELKAFIVAAGLSERVKLLGHIPKREQIEVMKRSLAVVQPTLFEGGPGGGCVYDAVALDVPVILSNISVNREVEGKNIWFFNAGDSEDLGSKMEFLSGVNIQRAGKEVLLKSGQENLEKLGDRLMEAVGSVVGH